MKMPLILMVVFISFLSKGQQTIMYTQYTFNKAGMNPAASGTDIDQEYVYTFGTSRQWVGMDNSPRQSFFNLSYTIRPPRSYKRWQNAGLYADTDDSGLIGSSGVYGSYTVHWLIRKKMIVSAGVYAGARRYARSQGYFDSNDPAVQKNRSSLVVYPDIIPGIRVTDKKYFIGFSVRQITINKLRDFKGHRIGSPSRLNPSLYFEYGRMITLSERVLMMPSIAVNIPIISPPLADASLLFYFGNRLGLGVALRNASFASGILQLRFLPNVTAGFSYSYPLNLTRYAAQNSFEVMIGVTPMGMNTKLTGRHSIARCPTMSY
jgi:type IX secretion system PorP/SprF family membrane protein